MRRRPGKNGGATIVVSCDGILRSSSVVSLESKDGGS